MIDHVCITCGSSFYAARSDAKFCSSKCRQKHYRHNSEKTVSNNPDKLHKKEELNQLLDGLFDEFIGDSIFRNDTRHVGERFDTIICGQVYREYEDFRKQHAAEFDQYYSSQTEDEDEGEDEDEDFDILFTLLSEQRSIESKCNTEMQRVLKDKWHNGTVEDKKKLFSDNCGSIIKNNTREIVTLMYEICFSE